MTTLEVETSSWLYARSDLGTVFSTEFYGLDYEFIEINTTGNRERLFGERSSIINWDDDYTNDTFTRGDYQQWRDDNSASYTRIEYERTDTGFRGNNFDDLWAAQSTASELSGPVVPRSSFSSSANNGVFSTQVAYNLSAGIFSHSGYSVVQICNRLTFIQLNSTEQPSTLAM